MIYRHQFTVKAPLQDIVAFHRQSTSMGAITPPPVIVRIHSAPVELSDGDEMQFTLWLGPLPINWHARIESVSEMGFVDRQLNGPFTTWEHHHIFEAIDEEQTVVIDEVTAVLSPNWFWKAVGMGMWLNLPFLFAYRGWKTRRLLEKVTESSPVFNS